MAGGPQRPGAETECPFTTRPGGVVILGSKAGPQATDKWLMAEVRHEGVDFSEVRARTESIGAGVRLTLAMCAAGWLYVAATWDQPGPQADRIAVRRSARSSRCCSC